jgi:hemoglobin
MTTHNTSEPMPSPAFEAIDEAGIAMLVDRFYNRVRTDDALGPVFNDIIHDWPNHKQLLCGFWSSMVLRTGRYSGNPMRVHRALPPFPKDLFHRWLTLWRETAHEVFAPAPAAQFIDAAERVAQGLSLGLNLGSLGDSTSQAALGSLRIVSAPAGGSH